jgi:hypothetical protein
MIGDPKRAKSIIIDRNINYTGNALTDVQSVISWLTNVQDLLSGKDWDWLDMDRTSIIEFQSQLEDAVSSFASNLADVRDIVKDSSQSFKDIYDELSGTDYYKIRDLQNAFNTLGNSIVGNNKDSMLSYMKSAVAQMEGLGESYLSTARSLLENGTINEQVQALKDLSEQFGVTFNNSTEEALNFLDSIELVAEAMSTSQSNIQRLVNMTLSDEELLRNQANALGVKVASNMDDLTNLFLQLAGGIEGMSDAEADFLSANYEMLQSSGETKDVAKERADLEERLFNLTADLNKQREKELQSVDETNRALLRKIHAEEDYQKVLGERTSLEDRLFNLTATEAQKRAKELSEVDPSNRGILQSIFNAEDAKELSKAREDQLRKEKSLIDSIGDKIEDLINEIMGTSSTENMATMYAQSMQEAKNAIQSGADNASDLISKASSYASSYLSQIKDQSVSKVEYQRAVGSMIQDFNILKSGKIGTAVTSSTSPLAALSTTTSNAAATSQNITSSIDTMTANVGKLIINGNIANNTSSTGSIYSDKLINNAMSNTQRIKNIVSNATYQTPSISGSVASGMTPIYDVLKEIMFDNRKMKNILSRIDDGDALRTRNYA